MDKTATGIVVNYDYYLKSQAVRDFVYHRADKASIIAFAPNHDTPTDGDHLGWSVFIGNHGKLDKSTFKVAALSALSAHSNVYPAIALDNDSYEIYDDAGVLIVLGDIWFG